ncbi:nicotinate-nucleotide--dimethylbenzimidazole phosphoribosyltransferase [Chitinispirillales bacterium ANBcel5]|uniref:nicotinate-nucleotide--dimethylbenzimidazole phosphoribosyltransferase n=1 Tax=Cellulosispirillum alkaliphilum TaxID=3039283 RepID=UPI002A597AAD|nr:nicotinate-nucleotide--dimethylbenzimidazole phosphoribosyltransferase [Chitinispirillales bacterium ANBcel5]
MLTKDIEIKSVENTKLETEIQAHLDDLTKPKGSLGRLEEFALKYCLCRGRVDADISRKSLMIFAADHGITSMGVAPFPKEVTVQMVTNMLAGGAAVVVMCKKAGIEYRVVDVGVDGDFKDHPLLIKKKVGKGTNNFHSDCAMSSEECDRAINTGLELASKQEVDITSIGEMGIGNTSSASALYALFLTIEGASTVGMGTGAVGELLQRKRRVIDEAVSFHKQSWDGSPVDALRRVGGFEIAAMTGYILGSAQKRIPVVIDGFIATASALAAIKITPGVKDYLFFGHVSDEQFHRRVIKELDVRPILELDMRLGEGTGAVLGIEIIEQALNCYHNMATFSSAGVSESDS